MKTIVIGAGSDLGTHIDGAKLGSVQLLNDLQSFYKGDTISFQQPEDIIKSRNLSDREKNKYELEDFNTKLYNTVLQKTQEEYFPVVIGGDLSVSIPSALANLKKQVDIGTIFISANTNYCTRDTTTTGNLNEFSLMTVSNQKNSDYRHYHGNQIIQPSKTVVIGVRNIKQSEKEDLKYSGVTVFTMEDIKQKGIEEIDYYINICDRLEFDNDISYYISYSLNSLLILAKAILLSALNRKESRGSHIRMDYPNKSDKYSKPTYIRYMNGKYDVTIGME